MVMPKIINFIKMKSCNKVLVNFKMMLSDCGTLFEECVLVLQKGSPGVRGGSSHLSPKAALSFGRLAIGTLPMRMRLLLVLWQKGE